MRVSDSGILSWSIWPNWSETKIQKVKCPIPDDNMPFWTLFHHCYLIADLSNDFRQNKYLRLRFVWHLLTQMHSIRTWSYQVLDSNEKCMVCVPKCSFLWPLFFRYWGNVRLASVSCVQWCISAHDLQPPEVRQYVNIEQHWTCNKCFFLFCMLNVPNAFTICETWSDVNPNEKKKHLK